MPCGVELIAIGQDFLSKHFPGFELPEDPVNGSLWHPDDEEWLRRRREKLSQWSNGRIPIIHHWIWCVSDLLAHPHTSKETFLRFARRVPSNFLAMVVAVALRKYEEGDVRAINSDRARALLSLAIILWLLCSRDPNGGRFGYIIRGIPYGAWRHLLARYEDLGVVERKPVHVNTVWGTHRADGRYDKAELGYMAALRQAGVIRTHQPNGWTTAPGLRGLPRLNKHGEEECWAFVEIRLRIPSGLEELECGPPSTCLAQPKVEAPPVPSDFDVSRYLARQPTPVTQASLEVIEKSTTDDAGERGFDPAAAHSAADHARALATARRAAERFSKHPRPNPATQRSLGVLATQAADHGLGRAALEFARSLAKTQKASADLQPKPPSLTVHTVDDAGPTKADRSAIEALEHAKSLAEARKVGGAGHLSKPLKPG